MARSGVTALSLVCMLALLEFGSFLRCYQCVSENTRDCAAATPPKSLIVDCATQDSVNFNRLYLGGILPNGIADGVLGASRFCHKIVMKNGSVARTCLVGDAHNLSLSCSLIEGAARVFTDPAKQIQHCSACDKDECNSAGAIAVSLPLAFLGLVLSYFVSQQ
ncbi:uncharacterized protein LOC125231079 [Leguminivora glycinivorella]|uniref:uncharacterized protein LOC125231079 n=1 Tax=Leguminivora glycinivorella TaxID=1035111 RepID=UPI00200C83BF|nr:uncharacterized protein LOC125231079 [Leguminivora glycinivorella]